MVIFPRWKYESINHHDNSSGKPHDSREKRKAEFETYMRHMINRFNKDVVEDTHKVSTHTHTRVP